MEVPETRYQLAARFLLPAYPHLYTVIPEV